MSDTEEDNLTCPICKDLCREAVEASCCHQVFCAGCAEKCKSCPTCRNERFKTTPNIAIRRLIGAKKTVCEHCKERISRADYEDHLAKSCKGRGKCDWCGIEMERFKLTEHLTKCQDRKVKCPMCEERLKIPDIGLHLDERHGPVEGLLLRMTNNQPGPSRRRGDQESDESQDSDDDNDDDSDLEDRMVRFFISRGSPDDENGHVMVHVFGSEPDMAGSDVEEDIEEIALSLQEFTSGEEDDETPPSEGRTVSPLQRVRKIGKKMFKRR